MLIMNDDIKYKTGSQILLSEINCSPEAKN
jgi:hypothetical protein